MNPAQQALDLLRNQLTLADLQKLSEPERQKFAALCHHWQQLASQAQA